jgi:FtsP/CotA-like multicopper oxidase with cupredoxin domain
VIQVNAGQVERWRFINASSARYVRLSLGGKKFRVIATDGGFLEKAVEVEEILLTPGERYDIIAGAFEYGECFSIESLAYNRMTFKKSKTVKLATVVVEDLKNSNACIPSKLRTIERIAEQDAKVTRKIKFSVGPSLKRGMDFLVNSKMHANDENLKLGELQVWEVANTSLMDHPFHLHGFFFQVLDVNGKAPAYLAWKDTVNLPPRSKVKIAWMPDREGNWMYHCHILEHHAAGMMGHFSIQSAVTSRQSAVHHHH